MEWEELSTEEIREVQENRKKAARYWITAKWFDSETGRDETIEFGADSIAKKEGFIGFAPKYKVGPGRYYSAGLTLPHTYRPKTPITITLPQHRIYQIIDPPTQTQSIGDKALIATSIIATLIPIAWTIYNWITRKR